MKLLDAMRTWVARRRSASAAIMTPVLQPTDDGTYRAAMRHSARVRFFRKAIPVTCVAAMVGPIAWGVVAPFARSVADVKVGPMSVSGTKVTMESPKLSGFKKDNKAYEVTAQQAIQDLKQPSVVELNMLTARMEQDDRKFARLTSDWGRLDQTADRLDLKGNVRVRTDNGYEADMLSARISVKTGDVVSTEPVTVRSQTGTISADRMEVRDNGKHAVFEGRVRSLFTPQEEPVAGDAAASAGIRTQTQ
jgi:lipopolysaccharide export system protein LptC